MEIANEFITEYLPEFNRKDIYDFLLSQGLPHYAVLWKKEKTIAAATIDPDEVKAWFNENMPSFDAHKRYTILEIVCPPSIDNL
jgi:hypothetical protein